MWQNWISENIKLHRAKKQNKMNSTNAKESVFKAKKTEQSTSLTGLRSCVKSSLSLEETLKSQYRHRFMIRGKNATMRGTRCREHVGSTWQKPLVTLGLVSWASAEVRLQNPVLQEQRQKSSAVHSEEWVTDWPERGQKKQKKQNGECASTSQMVIVA